MNRLSLIEGQKVRAVELIIFEVERSASLESDSEGSDAGRFNGHVLGTLGSSELAMRVL